MEQYLRGCAGALLAVILYLTLGKQGKEMGTLLTMAVCSMICAIAMSYLKPVMDFVEQLEITGNLDRNLIGILLKAAGIGFLSEIACLVCADAGNSALGKSVQILGTGVILWLSIPLFQELLELLERILGGV